MNTKENITIFSSQFIRKQFNSTFKNFKARILKFTGQCRRNAFPSLCADLSNKIQYFDFPGDFFFSWFSGDGWNASEASETLAYQFGSNFSCLFKNYLEFNMFSKKKN